MLKSIFSVPLQVTITLLFIIVYLKLIIYGERFDNI